MNQVAVSKEWFQKVNPDPNQQDIWKQTGELLTNVKELLDEMKGHCVSSERSILNARRAITTLSAFLESGGCKFMVKNDEAFLDSLCKMAHNLVGVGHTLHYDMVGAIAENNRSNLSMFDKEGKPTLRPNGDVIKHANYSPPNLDPYIL